MFDKVKFAMVAALNLEPYLLKKGAVNPEENKGRKRFEDFILSSSILAGIERHNISNMHSAGGDERIGCYEVLYDAMYESIAILGKTRMWGAMELLLPWAYAKESNIRFIDFLGLHTNKWDVKHLRMTRKFVWGTSENEVKKHYLENFSTTADNILDHYKELYQYGEDIGSPMISVWAEEILKGLPTVQRIKRMSMGLDLNLTIAALSTHWEVIMDEGRFSVGQLADYTVVVLYDKIVELII